MPVRFFPYRRDPRWAALLLTLGVTRRDGVELTADGDLHATFGHLKLVTPLTNVSYTEVTGPHRWWTAVGARLSLADDGLTFGTNHQLGLCIAFDQRVPRVLGFRDHSALWVSVKDPHGLAAALAESSRPG